MRPGRDARGFVNRSADRQPILDALTTEHVVMESALGTSVNEQQARASMYLYSVSGALVAIAFMTRSEHFFLFVAAILTVLFLAGLLTILRLVDISMESMQSHVTIARIRGYYRSLGKEAEAWFDKVHGRWPEGRTDSGHITGPLLGLLTTAASMIACVNAFIGGALLALLLDNLRIDLTVSVVAGAVFALAQVVAFYRYQTWRIDLVIKFAQSAGIGVSDDGKGEV